MPKDFQNSAPSEFPTSLDIPIFQKTYDFYKELYLSVIEFPKNHKYTLGQKLDTTTSDLLELFILASRKSADKSPILEKANAKLELLKTLIRMAKDTQSLDNSKYIRLEAHLQEIGKMLGGWIKHAKQVTSI
jgi:hypothetical protein